MDKTEEINKKIQEFGGLLDEQTALLLIEYESGKISDEKRSKLKARIERMLNSYQEFLILEDEGIKEYRKKDGQPGRYLALRIVDQSGAEARLLFWDAQIEMADRKGFVPGERLILINCSRSEGKYGVTYTPGPSGTVRSDRGVLYPANK